MWRSFGFVQAGAIMHACIDEFLVAMTFRQTDHISYLLNMHDYDESGSGRESIFAIFLALFSS